jgi:pimeloyl-ACP methyl ester carboxylesterase
MSTKPYVLFLHGGPGFSAELERRHFGARLPVHWWDQPKISPSASHPFQILVEAAQEELRRLANRCQRPIALMASSYGARLALELLRTVPGNIARLTISGGVLDLRRAFVCLGQLLAVTTSDAVLGETCRAALASRTKETFWALANQVTSEPDLLRYYFSANAPDLHAAMSALAAQGLLLDAHTFHAVVNTMLDESMERPTAEPPGGVRVLLGSCDPYRGADDAQSWRALFPNASIDVVEAGHFPHLELPPNMWLPRS